jgi:GAF domain-containing protein
MAARLFGVPIAMVSMVDADRQWLKSCVGMTTDEIPRSTGFCGHAILGEGPMVVPDASADERFASNPLVTGPPGIAFYAGEPIRAPSGEKVGTFCIVDHEPGGFPSSCRPRSSSGSRRSTGPTHAIAAAPVSASRSRASWRSRSAAGSSCAASRGSDLGSS